jgi:hypothetical protein
LKTALGNGEQFSETCLQILVERNYFKCLEFLINNVYTEENNKDVVPVLKTFISKVRKDQDNILELANFKQKIVSVSPAFQWAQDLDSIALSIKFAHRLDSPSCIDIFDQNVTITDTNLTISCMCKKYNSREVSGSFKSDYSVFKYVMNHELYEAINATESYYEFQSAGRLYVNLTKSEKQKRWRRLLKSEERPDNMRIWYELYDTIGDLEDHTTFETDDAFEDLVHIESPRKRRKKPKKRKRKKKGQDVHEDL